MKEIVLKSGNILKLGDIPFETANNLKKIIIQNLKSIEIKSERQLIDLCKDYLCLSFGSNEVEKALWECMKRCTYDFGSGDLKIEPSSFNSYESRFDFTEIQFEVAKESLLPFGQSLLAVLQQMLATGAGFFPKCFIDENYESELIMFRLAKAGYGSVKEIEEWPVGKVIHALHYETFCSTYEEVYLKINEGS